MMQLKFSKMHGLGNDFMVVDLITQRAHFSQETIQQLANRHTGIGFDQLLLVEHPGQPHVDFKYRIFNSDGSEVENCGNGARCFARFVYDQRLTGKRNMLVEAGDGLMKLSLTDDQQVMVDMGAPILEPDRIPFDAPEYQTKYEISAEGIGSIQLGAVSMGNPHAVIRVDDVTQAPVEHWGPIIEPHPSFPNKVNAGFMQVVDSHHINLRVFERGVGETRACGTGACAAVVSGQLRGWLKQGVTVSLTGGDLFIDWDGNPASHVRMTGPATHVFNGQISI